MTRESPCTANLPGVASPCPLASGLSTGVWVGGILALAVVVFTCLTVLRNGDLSSGAKAMWFLIVLLLPVVGSLVYFGVRSDW